MATDYGQGIGFRSPSDLGGTGWQGHPAGPGSPDRRGAPGASRRSATATMLRAPLEPRMWREFGYLLLSLPLSVVVFSFSLTMLSLGAGLLITFLGVPILAGGLAACRGIGAMERMRARALLHLDVESPGPLRPKRQTPFSWIGAVLRSGVSWRHALYTLLHFPWAVFAFSVALALWATGWMLLTYPLWHWLVRSETGVAGVQIYGDATHVVRVDSLWSIALTALLGLVLTLLTPWVVRGLAGVDRLLVKGLLGPSLLASRVGELESDRGVVVDTAAADLRRIERDLHDGAQARLVALAMDLGLAKEKLLEDPEAAARMVDEAHGEVKTALQELRDLARGIHPAVLTDRGLDAALSSVASRCTVPVRVEVDLPYRPAAAIEGIAYFTVSELLQNISKHARATRATVEVWQVDDRLMLQVGDDGQGGASAANGSGLAGLAGRLDAVDGVLVVDSPAGGPTSIVAELPWRTRDRASA